VADQNGYISIIDPRTHDLAGTVQVGAVPYGVAADPGLGLIYVTDDMEQVLYALDARTYAVVSRAPLPNYSRRSAIPHFPAVNLSNHMVYLPNFEANDLSVFDGTALRQGYTQQFDLIAVGNMPTAVAVNPRTNRIYVANTGSGTITVINGNTDDVVATVPIPNAGSGVLTDVVADPCCSNLVFAAGYQNEITVIDGVTNEVTGRLGAGGAYALALDTSRGLLYAIDDSRADVSVFDICSGKRVAQIPLPDTNAALSRLTVDASNHLVYVTDEDTGSVYVIDGTTQSLLSNVNLGGIDPAPMGAATLSCQECGCGCGAAGPETCTVTGNVYALQSNEIGVIDPKTHEEISSIGLNPSIGGLPPLNAFAYNPTNGQFYVGTTDGLFMFDAQGSAIDHVLLGASINRVAYNPTANKIYAGGAENQTVYIYDANDFSLLNTLVIDTGPDFAVDPVTKQVYASQVDAGPVVISGTTDDIVTYINIPTYSMMLAIDPARGRVYSVSIAGAISVINTRTNTIIDDYALASGLPLGIAVNPNTNLLYANYGNKIDLYDAASGTPAGTLTENVMTLAVDPVTNLVYYYNDVGDTVILDGSDNSYLGSIAMNEVLGFAPGTSEECTPSASCPGIFVAGGEEVQVTTLVPGSLIFNNTQIDLGGNVTTSDGTLFTVNVPGVYEINVRIPIRSEQEPSTGEYVLYYHVAVNGNVAYRSHVWNVHDQNWRDLIIEYVQLFQQLNAGDVISVVLESIMTNTDGEYIEQQSIAIRKIC